MNKTQFIQHHISLHSPATPSKMKEYIKRAENMWDGLTEQGYGAPKQHKEKEARNWYQELTVYQREWFDKFWIAFDHKHGKQRAAKAWIQIGEQTEAKYKQIVEAAKAEANKFRKPHETRKMAEGWLTEYRFEDHITKNKSGKGASVKRSLILNEIKALEGFNSDGTQDDGITKLKKELATL